MVWLAFLCVAAIHFILARASRFTYLQFQTILKTRKLRSPVLLGLPLPFVLHPLGLWMGWLNYYNMLVNHLWLPKMGDLKWLTLVKQVNYIKKDCAIALNKILTFAVSQEESTQSTAHLIFIVNFKSFGICFYGFVKLFHCIVTCTFPCETLD